MQGPVNSEVWKLILQFLIPVIIAQENPKADVTNVKVGALLMHVSVAKVNMIGSSVSP